MPAAPLLEIVVPVHDEAALLARSIGRLTRHLAAELPFTWRITIVDSVMPMGGFSGGDPAMTPAPRRARARRRAALRPRRRRRGRLRRVRRVRRAGRLRRRHQHLHDRRHRLRRVSTVAEGLYDCKDHADAITEAAEAADVIAPPEGGPPFGVTRPTT
jgi:hypothetical protein